MINILIWIVLGFFILVSLLDWKFKAVPSILMTGMLFVVAFVNTIFVNEQTLIFGILSYILAVLISELDYNHGMADIKATVIIGFMITTWQYFLMYIILLSIFQLIYTYIIRTWIYKKGEFPFLPLYLIIYVILMFGGIL